MAKQKEKKVVPRLTWVKDEAQYASGEHGMLGKVKCFDFCWSPYRRRGEDTPPWALSCGLPGIKDRIGHFATPEEAKERAEQVLRTWLNWTGLN